jgi:hypothetical protein
LPYIQPNTNNIFGLNPVQGWPGSGQTGLYAVSSSEATAILPGDAIIRSSIGTLRAAVTADTKQLVGAAAQALTTSEFAQGTLNLLVYDDPQQHYVITNASSASAIPALINVGMNMGIVTTATGVGIPSALVSRSNHALSVVAASSFGPVRLVAMHPIETYSSTPAGSLKWIVKPALPYSNLTT